MNRQPMLTRLSRWTTLIAVLAVMPVASASMTPAQDEADPQLPKAEVLLDKYVEATGGKDAHLKLTTRKKTGTLSIDMAGHAFKAKVEEQYQAPDKSYILVDASFFQQVHVCDGAWASPSMSKTVFCRPKESKKLPFRVWIQLIIDSLLTAGQDPDEFSNYHDHGAIDGTNFGSETEGQSGRRESGPDHDPFSIRFAS